MQANLRKHLELELDKFQSILDKAVDQERIPYGTAGFRARASKIEHLIFKVGLIAGIRCLQLNKDIGIMITASHNPVEDNGVKLIDPNGEMLSTDWEPTVEEFCNLIRTNDLLDYIHSIILKNDIHIDTNSNHRPTIHLGWDTRPSSSLLVAILKQGLSCWSQHVLSMEHGAVTTPILHYLVAETNKQPGSSLTPKVYYSKLIEGLKKNFQDQDKEGKKNYRADQLVVDCSNGIGGEALRILCENETFSSLLPIRLINTGDGILNEACGADFVKSKGLAPTNASDTSKRYASLDGDADRLVYFYLDADGMGPHSELKLLDGDKIMALYAHYLKDVIQQSGLGDVLSLGIVQTAYANGASTDYMTKVLGLRVDCVDTGVKNVHKQAAKYDVGIYFEANGHGTIWLSDTTRSLLDGGGAAAKEGLHKLNRLVQILNNYTGDAISDMLIVETILREYDWDVKRWYKMYQDRPNCLMKLAVPDRSMIETTDAARVCTKPAGLQAQIGATVAKFGAGARCFVRASGTEDVVRVYAEASDQKSANELARLVGDLVSKICNHQSGGDLA